MPIAKRAVTLADMDAWRHAVQSLTTWMELHGYRLSAFDPGYRYTPLDWKGDSINLPADLARQLSAALEDCHR